MFKAFPRFIPLYDLHYMYYHALTQWICSLHKINFLIFQMNIIWVKDGKIDNARFAIYTFIKIFSQV